MVSFTFTSAFVAAAMMMMASAQDTSSDAFWGTVTTPSAIASPTTTIPANAMETIGCFETGTPLSNYGFYKYQSPGNCQFVCLEYGKNVLGLSNGVDCWCGDKIPAQDWQVPNSTCDTSCGGTDKELCGGANKIWVMLTGNSRNKVEWYSIPADSSSSAKKSSTATPTSSTAAIVSASASPSKTASSDSGSKPNTAGIAAGVVVGVVGLAAIIGGVWYFLRRRRQHQAEEDYRRNAAGVNDFINGGKTGASSINDSRIDPSFMDRRQSNGSIADNEDYSRRILKVTNV
ncbi:Protein SLG1 [Ascochyta clinopodiicola]|nr:Protein SLG1 [Ascochyta clinopodiicola]